MEEEGLATMEGGNNNGSQPTYWPAPLSSEAITCDPILVELVPFAYPGF